MGDGDRCEFPFGGQIWKQDRFPFMSRYVVTGLPGPRSMALSSDPREHGNTLCSEPDGRRLYTQSELARKLHRLDYVCKGQLRDIIMEEAFAISRIT